MPADQPRGADSVDRVVVVARIGKAHGLRGEVTVQLRTDAPQDRFVAGARFTVERAPGDSRTAGVPDDLVLRSARDHNGVLLLAFEGVSDRTAAEALRGLTLSAPASGPVDEDDAWYEDELLGLPVLDTQGRPVGEVAALEQRPAQDLLVVDLGGGRQARVPFVRALVPVVDVPGRRVVIDPPEGLLELEQD